MSFPQPDSVTQLIRIYLESLSAGGDTPNQDQLRTRHSPGVPGKDDPDRQPTAGPRASVDGRAVRLGDSVDDGQAETEALGSRGAVRFLPPERLEEPLDFAGGHRRAGVGHGQLGSAVHDTGADLHRSARDVVAQGIVDEIGDKPFRELWVSGGRRGGEPGPQRQTSCRGFRQPGAQRLLDQCLQVERFVGLDAALSSGEGEQRGDELLLPRAGRKHPPVGRAQTFYGRVRIVECHLPEHPLSGQRRAHFVGGVGDELTLCPEGRLQSAQQFVEGVAELPQFVVRPWEVEAAMEIGRRDTPRGQRDCAQPPQNSSGDDPAENDGHQHHDRQGETRLHQQLMQIVRPLLGSSVAEVL